MHILAAAALLLAAVPLRAATIGGRLSYPSEELPGMTVVARNAAGATFSVETRPKQARYRGSARRPLRGLAIARGIGDASGRNRAARIPPTRSAPATRRA
jgi:hypothetical protein